MSQTYFQSSRPREVRPAVDSAFDNGVRTIESDSDFRVEIEKNAVLKMIRKSFLAPKRPFTVAAFDLDGTLIWTRSGFVFPKDGNDWKLLPETESLDKKLDELDQDRTVVALVTNQAGALPIPNSKRLNELLIKLQGVGKALPRVDMIFASLKMTDLKKRGHYRKPGGGMFEMLKVELNVEADEDIDFETSFYVGDAAGRKNDHSADDRGFAETTKLKFYTPEEYFEV